MAMLESDPDATDRYWEESVVKVKTIKDKKVGVWTLRSRVDQLLGGADRTQDAIDKGYYDSRIIHTKKGAIEEVRYHEHREEDCDTQMATSRLSRSASAMGDDQFRKKSKLMIEGITVKKKPAAATQSHPSQSKAQLALTDIIAEEIEPQVAKKPARAENPDEAMKRPAGIGVRLKEEDIEKQAEEADQQNEAVNVALQNCINQLRQRDLTLREWSVRMDNMEVEEDSREAHMKNIYKNDLVKCMTAFTEITETALHNYTVCKGIQWVDQKVAVMQKAATTIQNADKLIAELVANDKAKRKNAAK
eukprot:2258011-Lingulodinium_polyedra.AAC.1